MSAECCTPAQTPAKACQQQHVNASPAEHSDCCSLPAVTSLEALGNQAASPTASPPHSTSCHGHTRCQADICCKGPATPSVPRAKHSRQTKEVQTHAPQHAQHGSPNQACHSQSHSVPQNRQLPASTSSSSDRRTSEADQKLLWWPLDHVTVHGCRLAVGDSCYVITGHCVVCRVNDDLDMVECSHCRRFTHFACACPRLTQTPQGDFLCHLCAVNSPQPSRATAQAMVDAGTPGVGVLWISFMYSEMDPASWETQQTWIEGCMYANVAGMVTQLALNLTAEESIAPDAILGSCPVKLSQSAHTGHGQAHYTDIGVCSTRHELLMETRLQQYTDLYNERSSREVKPQSFHQFHHSYRPLTPDTYRLMLELGCSPAQCKARAAGHPGAAFSEPPSKRQRTEEELLKRVRSLVCPLQVEVVTRQSAGGGAIAIHRYMAAGSCMGVEVWQGPGLLGAALEQQLNALVQEWECKDASAHPTAIVDSSTAKRRKVYFGCRDVYDDPQLYWDVAPMPSLLTDMLIPALVVSGLLTSASDVHQAVLNIYQKGGYLVAHHDSEAHYQQPVLMIQLRSESALSFGYKPGGWSHVNEELRFLRIAKPQFSITVLKNEAFSVLKHCICPSDTQSGRCATLVLRNITPCQKP